MGIDRLKQKPTRHLRTFFVALLSEKPVFLCIFVSFISDIDIVVIVWFSTAYLSQLLFTHNDLCTV